MELEGIGRRASAEQQLEPAGLGYVAASPDARVRPASPQRSRRAGHAAQPRSRLDQLPDDPIARNTLKQGARWLAARRFRISVWIIRFISVGSRLTGGPAANHRVCVCTCWRRPRCAGPFRPVVASRCFQKVPPFPGGAQPEPSASKLHWADQGGRWPR